MKYLTTLTACVSALAVVFTAELAAAQSSPTATTAPVAAHVSSPTIVPGPEDVVTTEASKKVLESLRTSSFDRSLFSESMNKSVNDQMLARAMHEFGQMDAPHIVYLGHILAAGGQIRQAYRLEFKDYALLLQAHLDEAGKVDTFAVAPDTTKR